MTTIQEQSEAYGHRTTGFDYLRITLAFAVLAWHSVAITAGPEALRTFGENPYLAPIEPFVSLILPMFFALSGFLVSASLFRSNSIKVYLIFRGLRLFPALTVEIFLAAVILGPIVTTFALPQYFGDANFFNYFLNLVGLVQFDLPGVFLENPYPVAVNGSLWTVPYELECYIYLVIAFILGATRNRYIFLLAFIFVMFLVAALGFTSAKGVAVYLKELAVGAPDVRANLQEGEGRVEISRILVASFFAGGVIYAFADKIPFSGLIAAACTVLCYFLLQSSTYFVLAPLPAAYITVYLGLLNPRALNLIRNGDYSYGVYLYAFPIQQVLAMSEIFTNSYILHVLTSAILAFLFAMFSWHFIEKPTLKLKRHFISAKPKDASNSTPGASPSAEASRID